jgi:hypothetical protein
MRLSSKMSEARKAAARSQVECAFAAVINKPIYLDTVQVLVTHKDAARAIKYLASEGAKFITRDTGHPMWPVSIRIHQPQREVLENLEANLTKHLVNRVDVARDYVVDSQSEAEALNRFLIRHATQPWHGKRIASLVDAETWYLSAPWRGRNTACYASRPSKAVAAPCAHVEARLTTARQTRRRNADNLSGLMALDLSAVFAREARLTFINWENVAKNLEAVISASVSNWRGMPTSFSDRTGAAAKVRAIIARGLAYDEQGVSPDALFEAPAQAWLEAYPQLIGEGKVHLPLP